jgi:osmotically-inducible protein OsmY
MTKLSSFAPLLFASALIVGCSSPQAPEVTGAVRDELNNIGLRDVSVSQDRTAGVVTLSGNVVTEAEKTAAATAAQRVAGNQVIANEIVVTPPGREDMAEDVNDALDDAIESNMKALMLRMGEPDDVDYDVNAGVVRLKGSVASNSLRAELEKAAAALPDVKQVVNELQVENQRATTTR